MEQLEFIDCVSRAGIDNLRGFSYQIKVFLLYHSKIKENERVGYETIDDVSIQKLNESNFQLALMPCCIQSHFLNIVSLQAHFYDTS